MEDVGEDGFMRVFVDRIPDVVAEALDFLASGVGVVFLVEVGVVEDQVDGRLKLVTPVGNLPRINMGVVLGDAVKIFGYEGGR